MGAIWHDVASARNQWYRHSVLNSENRRIESPEQVRARSNGEQKDARRVNMMRRLQYPTDASRFRGDTLLHVSMAGEKWKESGDASS